MAVVAPATGAEAEESEEGTDEEAESEAETAAEADEETGAAGEGEAAPEAEAAPPAAASSEDGGEAAEQPGADLEEGLRVGQVLTVSIFEPGERVKVSANSKGRGFQGVVKRHGFRGYPSSHYVRVPGSVGPGTDPSRVIKGRKMGGRMGGKRRTVRNLEVVRVDAERNMLFLRGSVPGARNGTVVINKQ